MNKQYEELLREVATKVIPNNVPPITEVINIQEIKDRLKAKEEEIDWKIK